MPSYPYYLRMLKKGTLYWGLSGRLSPGAPQCREFWLKGRFAIELRLLHQFSLPWRPDCQQSMRKPPPADSIGLRSKRFRRTTELRSRSAVLTSAPCLLQIGQLFILVRHVKFRTVHLCSGTGNLGPEGNWTFGKSFRKGGCCPPLPSSAKAIASRLKLLIQRFQTYSVRVYGVRLVSAQCDRLFLHFSPNLR